MKIKSKYFFIVGLSAVLLAGISIITNHLGFALNLFQISFLIFLLATALYLYELNEK